MVSHSLKPRKFLSLFHIRKKRNHSNIEVIAKEHWTHLWGYPLAIALKSTYQSRRDRNSLIEDLGSWILFMSGKFQDLGGQNILFPIVVI